MNMIRNVTTRAPGVMRRLIVWPRTSFPRRSIDPSRYRGRTVVVTGGSSGIGEATAVMLGGLGARVVLLARSIDRLGAVATQVEAGGGESFIYPVDLSSPSSVESVADRILAEHDHIDMVVSNAGLSIHRSLAEAGERRDMERSIGVNFMGAANLILCLLPRLRQHRATIVNVSSVSAKPPPAPRWGSYQSTKAAFDVWLRAAGAELRGDGVTVRSVYMPLVNTPMTAAGGLYDCVPALTPEEAAYIVVKALTVGPIRIAPWWLRWQEIAAVAVPSTLDRLLAGLDQRANRSERRR